MDITYTSARGSVCFAGSGRGLWRILSVDGLSLAPRTAETVQYANEQGQHTLSVRENARIITMSCELRAPHRPARSKAGSDAMRILSEPGEIVIDNFGVRRAAQCYVSDAQAGECHGSSRVYAIQFTCDSPYFTDEKDTTIGLFTREDLLTCPFVIGDGRILTRRTVGGRAPAGGDVDSPPKIVLTTSGTATEQTKVTVTNTTTKKSVSLNLYANHVYTVDIEARTITSETGEDCIWVMDEGSSMADLYLSPIGDTVMFEMENAVGFEIRALLTMRRRYVEAVD